MSGTEWRERDDIADVDERPGGERFIKPTVWIISLFIVAVMIGIPVIRAVNYSRNQNPERAASEARIHVATNFAIDILERRSTRLAERWAIGGLHDPIDALVYDLQLRDAAELAGATSRVVRTSCNGLSADRTAECFHARLIRPDGRVVTDFVFAVAIVDGRAQVVRVGTIA